MSDFWKPFPETARDLTRVRSVLEDLLKAAPKPVGTELARLFGSGGKALRPAFFLLAARSGDFKDSFYTLAAALELLHLATLIHDDVIDEAALRRGEESLQARAGPAQAVLYGDLLFAACFNLVTESVEPSQARGLARVVGLMAAAEILQHQDRHQIGTSVRHALRKIMGKTAALFSLCFSTGATVSGQDSATIQIYRRFGYCLGMAFQIIDDILDLTSQAATLGKPAGWDLAHGIYTLPVVLALRAETGPSRALRGALKVIPASDRSREAIEAELVSSGAIAEARCIAGLYTDRARRELARLPRDAHRDTLSAVLALLLDRQY